MHPVHAKFSLLLLTGLRAVVPVHGSKKDMQANILHNPT